MNKHKKILWLISLLLLPLFMMTACKTNNIKSPEKLSEKPIYNEANKKIYDEIRKLTPLDTNFTLPQNAGEVGKINRVDLNNDGYDEIVTFKKKQSESQGVNSIYIYIFKSKNGELLDESEKIVRIPGDKIKYANFIDVDNNGKKNIVLQVTNKGFENIYVYQNEDDTIKKISEFNTSKYSMLLNFYDYDQDGKKEGLALLKDLSTYEIKVCKMNFVDGNILFDEAGTIKNVENLEKTNLKNGLVGKGWRGSILTYQGLSGFMINEYIVYKDGKFVLVFNDEYENKLNNISTLGSFDINKDGIIEISQNVEKDPQDLPKGSSIVTWYQWNGKFDKERKLLNTNKVLYCYDYNFKLNLKDYDQNRLSVSRKSDEDKVQYVFSTRDEMSNKIDYFKIIIIDKNSDYYNGVNKDAGSSDKQSNTVLYENQDYIYTFKYINQSACKLMGTNYREVQKSFEIINK